MCGSPARGTRLPITRKCCFCVPVRSGVIIFGYVNLILSLLSLPVLVYMQVEQSVSAGGGGGAERVAGSLSLQLPLSIAFVAIDTALTAMLLVAAHRKLVRLLRVYVGVGAALQAVMLAADAVYFEARHHLQNVIYLIFLGLNVYLLYLVWCVSERVRARHMPQHTSQYRAMPPSPPSPSSPLPPPTKQLLQSTSPPPC